MTPCPVSCSSSWCLLDHWQTLVVGIITAVLAIAAYLAARSQVTAVKKTLQAESMFKLTERFDSQEFKANRKAATKSCLEHLESRKPDSSVDDLLDIFEDAAFLVEIGALDIHMVWHSFYYWIRLYYQAAENYIVEAQYDEPTQWKSFCDLYPKLNAIEAKRQRQAGVKDPYTVKLDVETLRKQLTEELS